ncbi:MAG: fla cluster protein FlaF [Haloferacaceae archaeon]
MGFSVSGSTALLFVAALVAFGMFQSAATDGVERVNDARAESSERLLERRNAAINVTGVSYNSTSDELSVRVNNTGATSLSVPAVDLLVDNAYVNANTTVEGSSSTEVWLPGETLVANATVEPANRVKVVAGPGIAETEVV